MSRLTDTLKTVMTQPAMAALVMAAGVSIRYLWSYLSRSPQQFVNLKNVDELSDCQPSPELGISATSWDTCVGFLTNLKKTLPPDESKRLAKVGFTNKSESCGGPMGILNLEYKNPDTDQHLIIITAEELDMLTPDEIRAFLAHEVSHMLLKHDRGMSLVLRTLHNISLNLLLQKSLLVNLSSLGLWWNRDFMKANREYALVLMLSAVTLYVTSKLRQEQEFAADAKSITLTQNAAALISGLEKARKPSANNIYSFFMEHFQAFSALHPTLEQRIERLKKLSEKTPVNDTPETEEPRRYAVL